MKNTKRRANRRKQHKKTLKRKGGFFTKSNKVTEPVTNVTTTNTSVQNQEPKKYGSITGSVKTAVTRATKAANLPHLLGALSTKIDALLIHNKVNYRFSNGYLATDYDINNPKHPASGENEGRGVLKPGAKRGEITGFQSKVYNIGSDKYSSMKNNKTNKTTSTVNKTI